MSDTPAPGSPTDPRPARPVAVLIGFMGAGKSTVGRALAQHLSMQFLDTDHEIVARTGRSVEEIFAEDGEEFFRALEAEIVTDVLATHRGVVALGGGAVGSPVIRDALRGHRVVYLRVDPDAGYARVRGSTRPLLRSGPESVGGPEARYRSLLAERSEIYGRAADITIDTTASRPAELAVEISAHLGAITPPTREAPQ